MRKFFDAQSVVFEPDVIEILVAVLDTVSTEVQAGGAWARCNVADAKEILAKRIIETAKNGERDPSRLAAGALAHLSKIVGNRARAAEASS